MIRQITEIAANIEARTNLIRLIIANTANPKARNATKIKSVGNTRNRNRYTHHLVIMIHLATVTTNTREVKRRGTGKRIL